MEDQMKERLAELKAEFERGQKRLDELEREANGLRQALLRISGAVQVLEEMLAKSEGQAATGATP
jgi:predicted nuclease with TOPRIM domain